MGDNKEYSEWQELFLEEQKGISPEKRKYQPVSGISILPYLDDRGTTDPSFAQKNKEIAHSLMVGVSSAHWIADLSEQLQPYHIKNIYASNGLLLKKKELNALKSIDHESFHVSLPGDDEAPIIMDLRSQANIFKIKEGITNSQKELLHFQVIPGDDFLWNVAWVRGIRKYFKTSKGNNPQSLKFTIYVPIRELSYAENESQFIPLSNRILSMMVSGISHFLWDLRKASKWQKHNILTLLNVPEIIAREGKIFTDEDPIQGSNFFEELSDKIHIYLQE